MILSDRMKAMLLASEPSDRDREEGAGVELKSGVDYAVARALVRRGLGDVEGPGGAYSGLYFNILDGLRWRAEELGLPPDDDGCCAGCGACPGFIGAECDGDCAWAEAQP